ncbi:MAG: cytoskeletal protein CcmA (bactofilin family) [Alteromonas macleodii]|jgi:cytoskeletal protein CcmA (bactofilin family)
MFSKSTNDPLRSPTIKEISGEKRHSLLHNDVLIKGDWTSDGVLEFSGKIVGNLTADVLVLTKEGRVNGNVRARNITIEGQLEGTVSALNIVIKATAIVMADIKSEQILIEPGAEIQGNIHVAGKRAEEDT